MFENTEEYGSGAFALEPPLNQSVGVPPVGPRYHFSQVLVFGLCETDNRDET